MARRRVRCVAILFVFSTLSSSVSAFSAQLPRPWEYPLPSSTSLVQRRRRLDHSFLHSTSASKNGDSDDTTAGESSALQNEEDTLKLQLNGDSNEGPVSATDLPTTPIVRETSVRSSLRLLFGMTRPSNFPGVVLLHILGVYLALQSPYVETAQLLPTLLRPSMMVVLVCLLLTSAASMVVNDYFDNQIGVDTDVQKPLVGGSVTMAVAKKFLYYLYQIIAITLTFVPGVPARLMVVIGNMLTYWYTKHLKPITWLKNVVCASVMAISPATSGAAAFHLLSTQNSFRVFGVSALVRLVMTLFAGFVGREILMDINDVDEDRVYNVRTVAVAHGKKFASKAALISTTTMAVCATMGPLWSLGQSLSETLSWNTLTSTLRSNPGGSVRQLVLASFGCLPQVCRAVGVYKTEGEDRPTVEKAVDEGKLTFMLILASFI